MRVLGIAGDDVAGKSTVAGMLAALLVDQGLSVAMDSVAAPLKYVVRLDQGGVIEKTRDRARLVREADALLSSHGGGALVASLAARNGFDCAGGAIRPPLPGCAPADFLIVTDVRRYAEALFCQAFGRLVFVRAGKIPKAQTARLVRLEAMADRVVDRQRSLARLQELVRSLALDIVAGLF